VFVAGRKLGWALVLESLVFQPFFFQSFCGPFVRWTLIEPSLVEQPSLRLVQQEP
jgi:hypothetical protein